MRVVVCPADVGGCGFYRVIAPATVLKKQGLDIEIDYQSKSQVAIRKDGRIVSFKDTGHNIMVLQRPMMPDVVDGIPAIQANGTKVVVEIDDDFWSVDVKGRFFTTTRALGGSVDYLTKACKMADMVTVSTPALAKLVPNKNVVVLRNYVPAYYLDVEANHGTGWEATEGKTVVGWAGSTQTHVGDIERMGYSLRTSVRKNDAKFFVIGAEDAWDIAGFDEGEALYSPWVDLIQYPMAVKTFDVGIVPLNLTRFNQCKSYLKGMEYASLGIPFVASPTDEYKLLASHGVGLLAPQKHDWLKQMNRVLSGDNTELIENGLAFARENTYEKNAYKWAEAWASLL